MPEDEKGGEDENTPDEPPEDETEEDEKSETPIVSPPRKNFETETVNGKLMFKCPYPGCTKKSGQYPAFLGHLRFQHLARGQHLDANCNIIDGPKITSFPKDFPLYVRRGKKRPTEPPGKDTHKGGKHTTEDEEEDDDDLAESGPKAELKGKLRQLLKLVAMSPDYRDALMPTQEMLRDYIKTLSKARVDETELSTIENDYEDKLRPEVETILGKDVVNRFCGTGGIPPQPASAATAKMPTLSTVARIARLKGITKQYLGVLAKLPPSKRDELASERETLLMLTKRLSVQDLPAQELTEMEDILDGEVRPVVDSAVSAIQKAAAPRKESSVDETMGINLQQKQEELNMARMDRMLAEENMRHKQTLDAMRGGQGGGTMVPVIRPKVDERGNVLKDEAGKPVMETTYVPVEQAGSMNSMMMTLLLSGKLGGGDNAMGAILPAILDNNTKVLVAMLQQDKNKGEPSAKEMMLDMQNKNLEMMNRMLTENKAKTDDPVLTQMREELRATREAQVATQNQLHQQQLGYLQKEMEDLKRYAYRDDFESVLKQKTRLEELGLVTSNQKDADTKALEESRKALDKASEKLDGMRTDAKELFGPVVEAQAELIKGQARAQGLRRPAQPTYSEAEKKKAYKKMLENIEQSEEPEEEEEN